MTISDRKQKLRHRLANDPAASDMSLMTFGRFLAALDAARSHSAIKQIEAEWKKKAKRLREVNA